MMKKLLLIISFFMAVQLAYVQEEMDIQSPVSSGYNPFFAPGVFYTPSRMNTFNPEKRLDVGVQLGTSVSTDFNKGFSVSTMAAPELRYKVNDRFTLRGGFNISNTEYGNTLVYSPYGINRYTGNITQGMLYVSGDYMISPKVILSGTAYKEFSIDHGNPDNAFKPGYDGKGLMMNLRLMPSSNTTIDIGAEFYQGNNPWRGGTYNPFYEPMRPYW